MATSFTVNKADLTFILKQIKIAEVHAGGTPLTAAIQAAYGISALDAALSPFGLRTVDGTLNNLLPGQSRFGAADTLFPRLTDPSYRNDTDGDSIDFDGPGGAPPFVQGNYGLPGTVVDADPRIISNLIVDMSVSNPAAVSAWLDNPLSVAAWEENHASNALPVDPRDIDTPAELAAWNAAHPGRVAVALTNADISQIPNQSPDIGLSPGFNAWMTFFGQFFDHGLDLVTKGDNGTVYVPLQPDDPLIAGNDGILADDPGTLQNEAADNLPAHLQFMALTRAKPTLVNGVPQHENTTTSWVDQNQTYTSHPSHQVFLREYAFNSTGDAVSTGRLIDGSTASGSLNGAIGNWAEVKAQALEMLGIRLSDQDFGNVPLLATDAYGKFIPGANGYAQLVMAPDGGHATNWLQEGTLAGVTTVGSIGTNHAFLNDLAHHAVAGFVDTNHNGVQDPGEPLQTPDVDTDLNGDSVISADERVADDHNAATYDNEMLDAHFITGDGRGNENIALTTVHSIFHSEHNRLVAVNKATIAAEAATDPAFVKSWLLNGATADMADQSTWQWNGERLFQAARFGTEMQYQHMVFEEFARRMQPMVDPFVFTNTADIDPSILAEFAHTVYRFGHSMLTGTVDRLDNNLDLLNGDVYQQTLLAAFLNPQMYVDSGSTLEEANANLIRGLSRDVGNEIDEFIVSDVRSNLLGLPLDLAVLNLARGRETGIPSLNDTRAQLYNDFGSADLKPYTSWIDFAQNIKHPISIVNFIAAYGTHASLNVAGMTLEAKRSAAMDLVLGTPGETVAQRDDRLDFLNARDGYAGGSLGGLNNVDLWIGGLAEEKMEFGGMLGATFNFIFEYQMEQLQNGDRLYYLSRTQGLGFLNQLEPNTFSDIVMRNTELGSIYSTHLNGSLFTTPDHFFELDRGIAQADADPVWDDIFQQAIDPKLERSYAGASVVVDTKGTASTADDVNHDFGGYLRFSGGEHVVLGGTEGNDTLIGDKGIDTLWGDGGNDYLNAGMESDDVFGGEGDDIIEDPFGDDVLRGNQGNDVITTARGVDLVFGDQGNDWLMLGQDAGEVFAGSGDDFVLGGLGKDFLLGNEGDDWIEGGDGFDTIAGENSELFFNSPIIGHDVLFGQGNDQDYDAESGDDIMAAGPGIQRFEGMFGFDWAIAKGDPGGARFDFQVPVFTTIPVDILKDRFDQTEGASGWKHSDVLDGDDRGHKGGGSSAPDSVPTDLFVEHVLTQEGIDRINGLEGLLGGPVVFGPAGQVLSQGARETLFASVPGAQVTSYRDGNILMGGDGNDFLRGRGGYDILDGDAWLNVRISIRAINLDGTQGAELYTAESMTSDVVAGGPFAGKVYASGTNFDAATPPTPLFNGASLTSLLLNRTLNPGQLKVVREIKDGTAAAGETDTDTAIFQGTYAEYNIEGRVVAGDGTVLVRAADTNGDGFISVQDRDTGAVGAVVNGVQLSSRGALTDDLDLLKNIELLRFADRTIAIGGNNSLATGVVTIGDPTPYDLDGNPATPALVTPYVGQVLTATLSGAADADGLTLDAAGKPAGLIFQWQTTETGSNAGWSTIGTGDTYTVRSVDPGHILRAVAVFQDNAGVTETVTSASTDGATAAFRVNENSATGTVVSTTIPFNPDYDPDQTPGGPTDGDIVVLTHVLADSAGGRFRLQTVAGVQQIQVGPNGGPANLDYEVDNEYQIVINSYIDAATAAALDPAGLIASRQFTVLLNDLAEVPNTPATGQPIISDLTPVEGQALTLSTGGIADVNGLGAFSYRWDSSPSGTTWTPIAGATAATFTPQDIAALGFNGLNAQAGLQLRAAVSFTDGNGALETVLSAPTGPVGANWASPIAATFNGTAGDDIANGSNAILGFGGTDTLNGNAGNDILNGNGANDTIRGGAGNDTMNGGAGSDIFVFDDGDTGIGSNRDVIVGFGNAAGNQDVLNLLAIDANTATAVDDGFTFIGAANFSAIGQIRYSLIDTNGDSVNDSTLVQGNNGGVDNAADFEFLLQSYLAPVLSAPDFNL